ncbi:hypothetical protein [Paenibacillus woosongensis]|uniref:Uncharacterized protein n=1 Tax=Paenibacillus woosongensis TaxID=307580 RepID=A0ABQ4MQ02_9BACL|nr:hypothetical protein [Paenibacillus woosongensis]GIP58048.1 hypothetical protein J15TS10_18620 [Paenibacillus woosongensis]
MTHALPPKFPASSQTAGSVGLNDPPLTPDFAPLPHRWPWKNPAKAARKQFLPDHLPKPIQTGLQLPRLSVTESFFVLIRSSE